MERHKIIPASYLLLFRNDKILLSRRFNTGYEDGNYSVPAGHVEQGETFTGCLIREAKEEIGVIIKPKDLKVTHVMCRNSGTKENNERIDVFFVVTKWTGNIENKEPHKCEDISWFDIDNLPNNIIPYIRDAINNTKNEIFYSEKGW